MLRQATQRVVQRLPRRKCYVRSVRLLIAVSVVVACSSRSEVKKQEPANAKGDAGWGSGVEVYPSVSPTGAPMPPVPKFRKTEIGRWKSESGDLCFELFKNGDFQLSFPNERQKVQVLGHHEVLSTRGGIEDKFVLKVERVWFARYISNCRKNVIDGHWADDHEVTELGATFEKGKNVDITFKMSDDDHMEMCATKCVKLAREAPSLHGRWRLERLNGNTDGVIWTANEVIDLELRKGDIYESSVWVGDGSKKFVRLEGKVSVRVVDSDRYHDSFEIVMTVGGKPRTFGATRLTGERLRVCNGEHCTELERMFRDHDPE